VPIDQLKPAPYNPRKISKSMMDALIKNIKEFGIVDPLVVNKDLTIIGGHQRYYACKTLKIKKIPCVVLDLTKNKEKILNIALNKITGEFDFASLADLLLDLENQGEDLDLTGFTADEVEDLMTHIKEEGEGEAPEVQFTEELGEEQNYIVLVFDTTVDWLQAESLFDLKPVKALHSKKGFEAKGLGRVLRGVDALATLKETL
jgi:hypothetical protein